MPDTYTLVTLHREHGCAEDTLVQAVFENNVDELEFELTLEEAASFRIGGKYQVTMTPVQDPAPKTDKKPTVPAGPIKRGSK